MENILELFKKCSSAGELLEDGQMLKLSGQLRYITIKFCADYFKVEAQAMADLLKPYDAEPWVIYLWQGTELVKFYKFSEVRVILADKGIQTVKALRYVNRQRNGSWEVQPKVGGKKTIVGSEMTIDVDGVLYARQAYWAEGVGTNEASFARMTMELDERFIADNSYRFDAKRKTVNATRRQQFVYSNRHMAQEIVNRISSLRPIVGDPLEEDPQGVYASAFAWKEQWKEMGRTNAQAVKFSMHYYAYLKDSRSVTKRFNGVEYRAYGREDAEKAYAFAMDACKHL